MTQQKTKQKKELVTFPVGVARYPHLNTPDTKYVPQGELKVDVVYDSLSEIEPEVAKLERILSAFAEQEGVSADNINPVYIELDNGKFAIRFKQKAFEYKGEVVLPRPRFHDARGQYMGDKDLPIVGGGSRLSVAAEVWPYVSQETLRQGGKRITIKTAGLTLKPKAVQIVELATFGGADADYGFGAHEGFTAENHSFSAYQEAEEADGQQEAMRSDKDF